MLTNERIRRIDYFIDPVQVQFYYNSEWHLGIAYHDEIINAETGKVIKTAEIIMKSDIEDYPIETYQEWINLYR